MDQAKCAAPPVSFFDPQVQECPFPFYAWLRRDAPVYWDAETECHVVSRYDTIRAIALDTGTFSSIGMLQPPARSSAAATADAIRATTYPSVPMLVAKKSVMNMGLKELHISVAYSARRVI